MHLCTAHRFCIIIPVCKRPQLHKQQRSYPALKSKSFTSLTRSLSANYVKLLFAVSTGPPESKQQQRLRKLINNRFYYDFDSRYISSSRKAIATAYRQDESLDNAKTEEAFIFIKLLEASQARRYTRQLQGKPRKHLHLAGGGIEIQVLGKISSILLFPHQRQQRTTYNRNHHSHRYLYIYIYYYIYVINTFITCYLRTSIFCALLN